MRNIRNFDYDDIPKLNAKVTDLEEEFNKLLPTKKPRNKRDIEIIKSLENAFTTYYFRISDDEREGWLRYINELMIKFRLIKTFDYMDIPEFNSEIRELQAEYNKLLETKKLRKQKVVDKANILANAFQAYYFRISDDEREDWVKYIRKLMMEFREM